MEDQSMQQLLSSSVGREPFRARYPGRAFNIMAFRDGDDLLLRLVEISQGKLADAPVAEMRVTLGNLELAFDAFRDFGLTLDVVPELRDNLNAGLRAITDEMVDRYREEPPTSTGDEGGDPQA